MAAIMKSTKSKMKMPKKRKLEDMSVEEFMNLDSDDDVSSEASFSQEPTRDSTEVKKKIPKPKKKKPSLKDVDPEFYDFVSKEDKELLEDYENVAADDDDDDDDGHDDNEALYSDDTDDDDGEEKGGRFQPPSKLEVASDDDDDDDDDDISDVGPGEKKKKKNLITTSIVKDLTKQIQEASSADILRQWVTVLAAAAQHAGVSVEASTPYSVNDSTVFNRIMATCLTQVVPLVERLLTLKSLSDQQQAFSKKNKKWRSIKGTMKTYCTLMLQLSEEFAEANVKSVVLRHIHKLVVCVAAFPKLTKVFLKKMVKLWSTGEEATRVLAFLSVNKLVRLQSELLDGTLKQMYMAYVNNCKFVSPTTLPLISFMQRSLVELFLVQESLAYQQTFVYIRQLAIHLRNAITTKKKDMCQLVYNWQYVLSLGLWTELLSTAHPSPVLQPLIYPLVQVITGTIRLLPTARYYPLRFHCVQYLITLSGAAFIPVLPFLLEVLELTDFNRKQKGGGIKNINMSTILKFSKPQLQEKAFKEAVIDELCNLLHAYLYSQSHTIAFPELIVPLVVQLKDFLKKCKVAALCKQVKQVVEKAEENAKFIEARRRSATFNLADSKAVEMFESKNKEEGTPLSKFYVSWRKVQDRLRQKEIADKDKMTTGGESMVPEMNRLVKGAPAKASAEDRKEFNQLFGSGGGDDDDDDDEEDDTFRFLPKDEKRKRTEKRTEQELDSDEEEYSDFDSDDLEQLAKSASENEDSDDDDEDEDNKDQKKKEIRKAPKAKKQKMTKKQKLPAKSPAKRQKVHIENDSGDLVQDFTWSDSD